MIKLEIKELNRRIKALNRAIDINNNFLENAKSQKEIDNFVNKLYILKKKKEELETERALKILTIKGN